MQIQNTTLDDVAAVIGFSAALRLSAWFGGRAQNLYVPSDPEDDGKLVVIVGLENARRLALHWGGTSLAIPGIDDYENHVRKRQISRMFEKGFGTREIASQMRISERRVQQICRELEVAGLIPPQGPKMPGKSAPQKRGSVLGGTSMSDNAASGPVSGPPRGFFR